MVFIRKLTPLLTAAVGLVLPLQALPLLDCMPCEWEASAEFLYWRPCVQDTYFTILGDDVTGNTPVGEEIAVCLNYQAGARATVGGIFGCGDGGVRFRWEFLDTSDQRSVFVDPNDELDKELWVTRTAPNIPNTGDSPYDEGSAFSRVKTHYYAVDLEGWRQFPSCGRAELRGVAGVRWAAARYDQFVRYDDQDGPTIVTTLLRDNASFWGVGPYGALQGSFCLCGGWSLEGSAMAGLLVGEIASGTRQQDIRSSGTPEVLAVDRKYQCHTTPMVGIGGGVRYGREVCGLCVSMAVRYELVRYFEAIQRIRFQDFDREGINALSNTPLEFHGLSVRLGINY